MRSLAACLLLTGCFITEPINQRPSVDIEQQTAGVLHKGDLVTLFADTADPENQAITLGWSVRACTDATQPDTSCDATAFQTGNAPKFAFEIPPVRPERADAPVQSLLVELTAVDALGARAHPDQQLVLAVADQPPTLDVQARVRQVVEGHDFDVYAVVGDPDDAPIHTTVAWQVFTPVQGSTYTTTTAPVTSTDPTTRTEQLTVAAPIGLGNWTIQAVATDWLGATAMDTDTVMVVADAPPCIAQWSPIASGGAGAPALPLVEPTLFQIPVVHDDLDAYPGTAQFAWSVLAPGATTFAPLAATGNSVSLDPAQYEPGDQVELRVEVFDRNHVAIPCDPAQPTCSVTPDTSCIQRQTWKVEVH